MLLRNVHIWLRWKTRYKIVPSRKILPYSSAHSLISILYSRAMLKYFQVSVYGFNPLSFFFFFMYCLFSLKTLSYCSSDTSLLALVSPRSVSRFQSGPNDSCWYFLRIWNLSLSLFHIKVLSRAGTMSCWFCSLQHIHRCSFISDVYMTYYL